MSRRRLLASALAGAGGLTAIALIGCDSGESGGGATPGGSPTPTAPAGTGVPTFDSDGVSIHYEVYGEGHPIVLVHGFSASLDMNWVQTGWIDALTPIRQVVGLDARGHGLSDKPHDPAAYAGDAMQQDVLRLMDHLDIERADLFGYSMGAGISLQLLLSHPERFTSVILGGIGELALLVAGDASKSFGRMISDALLADDPATIENPIARGFRVVAEATGNDLEALAAYTRAPREGIDVGALAQVDLPVLIVNGADDTLVGSPDGIAAAIPGARLVKIPDRDHLTVVADPRFKEAVVAFLSELSPA